MNEDEINFDLDRMKKAAEGPYITLPHGMRREELRQWLRDELKRRDQDINQDDKRK